MKRCGISRTLWPFFRMKAGPFGPDALSGMREKRSDFRDETRAVLVTAAMFAAALVGTAFLVRFFQ